VNDTIGSMILNCVQLCNRYELSYAVLFCVGEMADSTVGYRSAVYFCADSSTLVGGIHGFQVAWRSSLWISRIFRRWSRIRFRRVIPGSFRRFSGESSAHVKRNIWCVEGGVI